MAATQLLLVILSIFVSIHFSISFAAERGTWQMLLNNTGVVAMNMALTHEDTVIMFDQTGEGPSSYRLRHGYRGKRCTSREDLQDSTCYAHSLEYNIHSNKVRPLRLETDPWGASGSFLGDGTLLQIGGYGDGSQHIRHFRPCKDEHCDWQQSKRLLSSRRWYSSSQILPEDDRIIVVGGREAFSYEFVPRFHSQDKSLDLPFLRTTDGGESSENNLYPFLHLSSDGNLFVFANRDSMLLNYRRNKIIKKFPRIPGGGSRNYPSSASSVILPLKHENGFQKVEVMVCGGAASGAYSAAERGQFLKALSSCGRMIITGNKHKWNMENMPGPRALHNMLILPTGEVLIINGAKRGTAGWNRAAEPSLEPYLYNPGKALGKRFSVLRATKVARLYASSAAVLPDGRILVGGSNPNRNYTNRNVQFPTELRLQAFVPHYMDTNFHYQRPGNVSVQYRRGRNGIVYGDDFVVRFWLERRPSDQVEFSVYAPPFTTHSISMNQRLLRLRCKSMERAGDGWFRAVLEAPPSSKVAPSGYYLISVVSGGIPSMSRWVRFTSA